MQVGKSSVPWKVLCHFPLVTHLWWMTSTPTQAELMVWHWNNRSQDGLMWHALNSQQWKFIDGRWPTFASKPWHVQLGHWWGKPICRKRIHLANIADVIDELQHPPMANYEEALHYVVLNNTWSVMCDWWTIWHIPWTFGGGAKTIVGGWRSYPKYSPIESWNPFQPTCNTYVDNAWFAKIWPSNRVYN